MDSLDDGRVISALAKLFRDELRETRFHVSHLARTDTKLVAGPPGAMSTTLEPTRVEALDADGLKALHDTGDWKRALFRSEIRVKTLPGGPESAARRIRFERLLDDLDVVSEGHVVHALAPLLPVYTCPSHPLDSPEAIFGREETGELWRYLLVDACLDSPRRTASKLVRWARGGHLAFETRVLLGRLHAAEPFALPNGLAVERLPCKSKDLGGWLPIALSAPPLDYLGRTILRIPCTVAPCFTKSPTVPDEPAGGTAAPWKETVGIETKWPLPSGGIDDLTRALSLVCDVAVETPMIWTDFGDHAHFGQRHGVSNMGTGAPLLRRASESPLTADDFKEAIRLQPRVRNPPDDVEIAIRYWLKSKDRRLDVADGLVYLRTALEALFLDRGNRAELGFSLATNGAWYTGRNRQERRDRFDVLKQVYAAGSDAVHGRRVKYDIARRLREGQEICREAIMKRLRSKQEPVWRDIVFGR